MNQHVLGLDVPVNHPLPVRVVQRRRHAPRDLDRLRDVELPLPVELVPQRVALHVRHHVEQERVGLPRIVQRQDVRVLQVGRHLDLLQKPLGPDHRRQLRPQHLQRHLAVVLHVVRQVHRRHPALAQVGFDPVTVGQRRRELGRDLGHGSCLCSIFTGGTVPASAPFAVAHAEALPSDTRA